MTKIPVKECQLCGALIADTKRAREMHTRWHKSTPAIPGRVQPAPVHRPPVLEEPSRRPDPFKRLVADLAQPAPGETIRLPHRRR